MKVLVCGSRTWKDENAIRDRLAELPSDTTIIHGACPEGADAIAAIYALIFNMPTEAFPADWKRHGKRAGIVRNLQMLNKQPDLVLAFWDGESRGTEHVIRAAGRRGIPVEVIR